MIIEFIIIILDVFYGFNVIVYISEAKDYINTHIYSNLKLLWFFKLNVKFQFNVLKVKYKADLRLLLF